ncbi:lysophospholipid acyltransferase family protein [Salinisphaera sp. T31B1]|uniref:lysophospholipid acyltransferase family protein n=1 Tax=Salinisphaera sp. T31B1 TaxID=727963 RepID=UPI00333F63B5
MAPTATPRKTRRKKDRPVWLEQLMGRAVAAGICLIAGVLRRTCRITLVHGESRVATGLSSGAPAIPCGWHQTLVCSGLFLQSLIRQGLPLGFLISPSREGDMIARVCRFYAAVPIRGSSTRSGSEAVRALTQAVADGIAPMIYGDGPRGPAHRFKPGAIVLASRSGAPLWPMGCAASRYWQMKSWDGSRIPKPFSHLTVAVGEPLWVGALHGTQQAEALAADIGQEIDRLEAIAEAAQTHKRRTA